MIDRITLRVTDRHRHRRARAGLDFYRDVAPPHDLPLEVMEVRLRTDTISTALRPLMLAYDPCRETREEYGHRLRMAARDAASFVERGILSELTRMGHLV